MTNGGADLYRLVVDGFDAGRFRVHAFTGEEALSSFYHFEIAVTVRGNADERLRVLGSRVDIVEHDRTTRIGHNVEEQIAGDRNTRIGGNRIEVVTGSAEARVSGPLVTRVEGKERRAVQLNADFEYGDDLTTRVKGCMTTLVGKADAKRSWVTHAEGQAKLSSLDSTEVSSEGELLLRAGKSSIRITSDQIEIQSPAVTLKGTGGGLSADDDGLRLSSKSDAQHRERLCHKVWAT